MDAQNAHTYMHSPIQGPTPPTPVRATNLISKNITTESFGSLLIILVS